MVLIWIWEITMITIPIPTVMLHHHLSHRRHRDHRITMTHTITMQTIIQPIIMPVDRWNVSPIKSRDNRNFSQWTFRIHLSLIYNKDAWSAIWSSRKRYLWCKRMPLQIPLIFISLQFFSPVVPIRLEQENTPRGKPPVWYAEFGSREEATEAMT